MERRATNSILAMTLGFPPQRGQVSIAIANALQPLRGLARSP
jgi:hypothetical protein